MGGVGRDTGSIPAFQMGSGQGLDQGHPTCGWHCWDLNVDLNKRPAPLRGTRQWVLGPVISKWLLSTDHTEPLF